MIERKKKLRFIQLTLLIFGILLIYLTYYNKERDLEEYSILDTNNKEPKVDGTDSSEKKELFYNIEYTGLDLNGNRFSLKSEEAYRDEFTPEIIHMTIVKAVFYFKDNTTLYVNANKGIYNNKTLDMKFEDNVKADYMNSKLFAEKAEYSNTKNYLSIYEKVRIDDVQGNLVADKLLFDIKKQKLDITSFNDGKINANVKLQ